MKIGLYPCVMKKTQVTKIRLALNLTSELVGYDKLFNELASIDAQYGEGSPLAAKMRRKHLIEILHMYCNNGLSLEPATGNKAPELGSQSDVKALRVLEAQDKNPVATTSSQAVVQMQNPQEQEFDPNDAFGIYDKHRLEGGKFKFGDLEID